MILNSIIGNEMNTEFVNFILGFFLGYFIKDLISIIGSIPKIRKWLDE